jgi:hypothetical protein
MRNSTYTNWIAENGNEHESAGRFPGTAKRRLIHVAVASSLRYFLSSAATALNAVLASAHNQMD